ncbi:MAG: hypothetical protein J5J06_16190 [Phycisphaerae bacterium]|nr:hypothetical protein [Phycisphaerae bacterium]
MRRFHLFEFHDLRWFPSAWRNVLTDVMAFFAVRFCLYQPIVPRLKVILKTMQCRRVVDLCSGAGRPVLSVLEELDDDEGVPITITLTDKYPNVPAFRSLAEASPGRVLYSEVPVDATDVPYDLEGFRTLFASFHHFDVVAAREIICDAVRKNQGIGIFEFTERNFLIWVPTLLVGPVFVWLVTPFIRPFSWQRLLWTYAIPIWMLAGFWDGVVSCLRTYSPQELCNLTKDLGAGSYSWEVGRVRSAGVFRITYLLGVPHGPVTGTAESAVRET